MPISTRLTELLKITHPILLAPMDVVADGKLAATVSNAGGFGIIGGGYGNEHWLTRELDAAGAARVGVGFITWSMAKNPRLLDIALERKPAAIMLSFGDVKPHAGKDGEWQQVEIIARGNTLVHILNGQVMSVTIDDNADFRALQGILSLQLEGSGQIWYRNVYVKALN